jgi:hypothetical protein
MSWQIELLHGSVMTDRRHIFRLSLLALVAVAGMLSVVTDASASTPKRSSANSTDACCLKRVCTVCCCESASASATRKTNSTLPRGEASLASRPAPPCECRSGDPVAPAPRPEPRPTDPRPERDRGAPVDLTLDSPRSATFATVVPPASGLSKAPLHLRTTRLLI